MQIKDMNDSLAKLIKHTTEGVFTSGCSRPLEGKEDLIEAAVEMNYLRSLAAYLVQRAEERIVEVGQKAEELNIDVAEVAARINADHRYPFLGRAFDPAKMQDIAHALNNLTDLMEEVLGASEK